MERETDFQDEDTRERRWPCTLCNGPHAEGDCPELGGEG